MSSPDELPELEGIDASDEFRRYVAELRQTWVPTDERAVSQAENRELTTQTPMSTEPSTDCTDCEQTMMTRRGAMKAGATAAATAVAMSAGAGSAVAATGLNFDGDYVQEPFIKGSVTVQKHKSDFAPLDFTNDSGTVETLANYGGVIAPRVDDTTPHNPVTLEASKFDVADYSAFPREETYDEDGDGSADTAVSALDVTHWTKDVSGSAGTMTLADKTSPADGPGLQISTSSQTTGDVALATFDSQYVEITSGEDRKLMQLVLDVDTLESGAVVTFRVRDEDGDVREAVIDPSADTANAEVIAASTVSGHVFQVPMGDLAQTNNGDGTFNNLQEVEIEIKEANADLSLYAFNLEKESDWVYGSEEFTNTDDELDTQEITEPSGTFSITGLDTLGDALSGGVIADVQYDVELRGGGLEDDMVEYEWQEASRYDHPYRLKMVYNFEELTAYDLDWSLTGIYDDVKFPSTRYLETGILTGQSEAVTLQEIEDDDVTLTSRTDSYANAAIGDEIELSTAIAPGDIDAVYVDILYTDDERSSAVEEESVSGPIDGEGGTGPLDWLFSLPGMIISAVVGYWGLARSGVFSRVG